MKLGVLMTLLLMAGSAYAQQEAVIFQPPVPHEVQRYEAGWNKNPFTLKTAPPVVESVSFAMDLAIGTYYGDSADPTIVIVNTKTNERIQLKKDQPAANGMKLSSVNLGSCRKDVVVEVKLGTETATIRFNDSYVKQIAAAEMSKAPGTQQQMRQQPGSQKIPLPQPPSQQTKGSPPGTTPNTAQVTPMTPGQPGFPAPSGKRTEVNQPYTAGIKAGVAPLVSQTASMNAPPPTPVRRRLITPVLNATPVAQ